VRCCGLVCVGLLPHAIAARSALKPAIRYQLTAPGIMTWIALARRAVSDGLFFPATYLLNPTPLVCLAL
jgi:hypothetical protein